MKCGAEASGGWQTQVLCAMWIFDSSDVEEIGCEGMEGHLRLEAWSGLVWKGSGQGGVGWLGG